MSQRKEFGSKGYTIYGIVKSLPVKVHNLNTLRCPNLQHCYCSFSTTARFYYRFIMLRFNNWFRYSLDLYKLVLLIRFLQIYMHVYLSTLLVYMYIFAFVWKQINATITIFSNFMLLCYPYVLQHIINNEMFLYLRAISTPCFAFLISHYQFRLAPFVVQNTY